jgi:hypothetical protein
MFIRRRKEGFLQTNQRNDTAMARKKRSKELQPNIKVRLDRRTVITVRDQEKLAFWKEKYPNLEVLEE